MDRRPKHRRRIANPHKQIQFRLRRGEVYCTPNRCTRCTPNRCKRCIRRRRCTGARNASTGAQFAHEPLRTTHPSGGWDGKEISLRRAPDGAAAEFEELRQLWQRPYGMNLAKALAAFNRVAGDGDTPAAVILESARRWVAAREPAFLPKLEEWLANGAWRNDPPVRRVNDQHKESAVEVAVRLAREGGAG